MAKIKLLSIMSISLCFLFQFLGCTHTSPGMKEEKGARYSLKATPAIPQSSPEEPIFPSVPPEYSLLQHLEPRGHLGRSPDFQNLDSMTSRNSLDDCTRYASILNKVSGKGIFQTDFPVVVNGEVKKFIQYFQHEKDFMRKALVRSGAYFPMMKKIFKKNNLPEDLVYLALIESGINPNAYSRAGACGPWQFMSATAKRYGLQVDLWVDERRDPEKSTRAAVKYLEDLYGRFGDWYLAVAAYNAGEYKVANAIKIYKTNDFWLLQKKRYLKLETRNFIPKLLAAILIGKHPEEYGFTELNFQEPISITSVHIPHPTELKFIAEMAGISLQELQQLNPELRKWCTPARKNGYRIKIPVSNKELFAQNFSRNKEKFLAYSTFHKHRIKAGETLYCIARRYNTKVAHIQKMNGIRNPRLIHPGQVLIIPVPPIISSS